MYILKKHCWFLFILLYGCVGHNVPSVHQTSKLHVSQIVDKVRCEMQGSIIELAKSIYKVDNPVLAGKEIASISKELTLEIDKYENKAKKLDRQLERQRIIVFEEQAIYRKLFVESKALNEAFDTAVDPLSDEEAIKLFKEAKIAAERTNAHEEFVLKVQRNEFTKVKNSKDTAEKNVAKKKKELGEIRSANNGYGNFLRSVIDTNFTFTITEQNRNRITFSGTWPKGNGTRSLNANIGAPSSGALLERKSEKSIKLSSTILDIQNLNCDEYIEFATTYDTDLNASPKAYPIKGRVGAAPLIYEFVKVTQTDTKKSSGETFSDTLTFTTDFSSGVDPSVTLVPVTNASVTIGGIFQTARNDIHSVAITIGRP